MGDRIKLAEGYSYSTDYAEANLNQLVIGGSGSGKTTSIVESTLLDTYNRNLIVAVSKRKLVEKYIPVFRARGYRTYDLRFDRPEKSEVAYDPLQFVASNQDVTNISMGIMTSDPRTERTSHSDPYWTHAGASVLTSLILAVLIMYGEKGSFADVSSLSNRLKITSDYGDTTESTLDDLFNSIEQQAPDCLAVSCFRALKTAPKTAACILGEMSVALQSVFPEDFCTLLERKKTLDIERFLSGTEKSILFVTTNPGNTSETFLSNLFYNQLLRQIYISAEDEPSGKLSRPLHMILDEFGVAPVRGFQTFINLFREKNVSCTLLVQGLPQLVSSYGESDAVMIQSACDTTFFFGCNESLSARYMADRLGTTVSDVYTMPIGTMVVCRRGHKPLITKRRNLLADPEYIRITREYEQQQYR